MNALLQIIDRDGFCLRADALVLGWDDNALARACRGGLLTRIRHGAYASGASWRELGTGERHLLRVRAAVRQSRTPVAVSHISAAVLHRTPLWDVGLDRVHLTRLDGRAGRKTSDLQQHKGVLCAGDVASDGGLDVTSCTRTALDLTTVLDLEHALPILDHYLHTGLTTRAELEARLSAMQYWPHSLGSDLAVKLADGRRESVGESRTFYVLWGSGLPLPEPQYKIKDHRGRVLWRLDFAWPELGVWLEFDGREKYAEREDDEGTAVRVVLREKKREEQIARMTGWRCIRITWADLYRPEAVVARIRAVLRGGAVHA